MAFKVLLPRKFGLEKKEEHVDTCMRLHMRMDLFLFPFPLGACGTENSCSDYLSSLVGFDSWLTLAPASRRALTESRWQPQEACIRGVQPFSKQVASRSASSLSAGERALCRGGGGVKKEKKKKKNWKKEGRKKQQRKRKKQNRKKIEKD